MAEEPLVSVSDDVWVKWLAAFLKATDKNIREGLYEEWPLLMRKVMDFTPPFKTKSQPGPSDFSVGRKATAFDIYKVMRPFNPAAKTKALEKVLETKDVEAYNAIAMRSHDPRMQGTTAVAFSPALHKQARDWRGRVPGRDRRQVVLGSDVGLLKKYVAAEQGNVGIAKAGWWPALALVGGDAPNYVTRHGFKFGEVIDDHANEENPSITAINRTPWAIRKDEGDRILSDAKASRIESIIAKVKARIAEADAAAKAS